MHRRGNLIVLKGDLVFVQPHLVGSLLSSTHREFSGSTQPDVSLEGNMKRKDLKLYR